MSSDAEAPQSAELAFARTLGLFDATMIGVGAMIGAGIFVLTGIAAGESGPASILAFALNGAVTLLTAFAYAELATAIPEAGGGYAYVRRAFPGAVGFTAGWMLWFAYTVACSLYALGFAGYFWEFFLKYLPRVSEGAFGLVGEGGAILLVTLLIGVAFIRLNARGAEVTGKTENVLTVTKLFVLGIFIVYGLRRVADMPDQAVQSFTPFFPEGMGGVFVAMGLTFIAFEGYDLIATVAEEIKEPEKNIPKATFLCLGITMVMYLLILFVSLAAVTTPDGQPSWQFLGDYGETAIVRAAEGFMPAFGVAIIVFGGLLSTMSALNATVMASSRVAFSMRRRARQDAARRLCDGRSVGAGAPFLGFRWSEAFFSWSQVGSRGAGLFRSPRVRLLSAPLAHGILGAHLGSTEVTPNAGRPTPGLTLAPPPSPPRRLPGGPGAAPAGCSDLVMPRLPVSTRSTGQGICLARSSRVARRTSLRTAQALTIPTRRPPDTHLSFGAPGMARPADRRAVTVRRKPSGK